MTNLLEKIDEDFRKAMKEKLENAKLTLSTLKSNIKYRMLELKAKGKEMTDVDIIGVINSMVKKSKESIEQFIKGGRKDLSDRELEQINIITKYLPEPLEHSALKEIIDAEIKLQNYNSISDMGHIMNMLKQNFAGRYDSKTASDIIKTILK